MKNAKGSMWAAVLAAVALIGASGCGGVIMKPRPPQGQSHPQPNNSTIIKQIAADADQHRSRGGYQRIEPKDDELYLESGAVIAFQSGSTDPTPESYDTLYEIWSYLMDNPDIHMRIEGNTDAAGDYSQNLELSGGRAAAIYQFLVDASIDPARLDYFGCGPDNPLDRSDPNSPVNRRVDFIIAKDVSHYCGGAYE
ncbi:MAG: OmpA family protein [Polyangiaceae bacterium]